MKLLHILRSEPDSTTETLMRILSEGQQGSVFALYIEQPDYENLIDMIFEDDKVICWW